MLLQATVVIFGLIIGSFLTVCVYRIPYGREKGPGDFGQPGADDDSTGDDSVDPQQERLSIFHPRRSFCPACRSQLWWWENIPLFSWILLRGRCRHCSARISWTYPLIEILTAVTALLSYNLFDGPTAFVVFAFCAALIVLSFIDAEYYILPNVITFPGIAIAAVLALINHFTAWFSPPVVGSVPLALWGLLAGAGFLFFVSEVYFRLRKKMGLGFGDVKLLAMTGLLFGPEVALGTIFLGSVIGTVAGLGAMLVVGHKLSKPLPFGPYLAMGTYGCLFMQTSHLWPWYY